MGYVNSIVSEALVYFRVRLNSDKPMTTIAEILQLVTMVYLFFSCNQNYHNLHSEVQHKQSKERIRLWKNLGSPVNVAAACSMSFLRERTHPGLSQMAYPCAGRPPSESSLT